uniref:Zn(2)-C6 fungal-type domain-containing protein n=1 Tax=Ganoderma boninense TaxID=34458 RepID=A0A5K1K3R1_9APHY|nr:Zn(2)-C6 fungal-type domain-containing protein [Ganoderma boninense]
MGALHPSSKQLDSESQPQDIVVPMSSYSELSSPPGSVDWESGSGSPVLVGQPHSGSISATLDRASPSTNTSTDPLATPATENAKEDPQLVRDVSDVNKEPGKPQSTYADSPHPGELASPVPMNPRFVNPGPINIVGHRHLLATPDLPPSPESAALEDSIRALPMPSVSSEANAILPLVRDTPSYRRAITPYEASSGPASPRHDVQSTAPMESTNVTIEVPPRSYFSGFYPVSAPFIPPPPSPSADSSDVIPPPRLSPTPSNSSFYPPIPPVHRTPLSTPSPPIIIQPPPQQTCSYPNPIQFHPYLGPAIPQVLHHYTSSSGSGGPSPVPPPMAAPMGCSIVPPYLRDDELWFEDGDVVLNTSNVEFRVYKGPLLALSPILKARCGDIRGTSFLSVGDISPDDLRHVLRFVSGGTSRVEPSFSEIAAHIRFGRKYKAEKLLQRSLGYLRKFYVTELAAWTKLPRLDPPFFEPVHAIGVVNLARLLGKDGEALLPIALMRCCMLGARIVEGYEREDGTRETLSPADLGRCFEGRVRLLDASVRAAETLRAHTTSDECSRPLRCKAALQRFIAELVGSDNAASGTATPAELCCLRWDLSLSLSPRRAYLQEAGTDAVGEDKLCTKCFARQLEEQRKIFARLPQMMGVSVEGWGTKWDAA